MKIYAGLQQNEVAEVEIKSSTITYRGKTSALAELPNCLIVDLEDGSEYIESYVVKAHNYMELYNIAKELKTTEHQFKFVALDTITALEDIALDLAARRYSESPMI